MKNWLIIGLFLSMSSAYAAGKDVTYKSDGIEYEGYYAKAGKNAPLVLIVHDWDGLNDYEKKRATMLTEKGYSVFAVDLYGKGVRPTDLEAKKKLTGELYANRAKMRAILNDSIAAAKAQGANTANAVIMGYCFGGGAVLELGRSGADLKGFISVHGGVGTPEGQDYSKAKGHFLVQHGAADTAVTIDQLAEMSNTMEKSHLNFNIEVFSGAPHAWTVFGSDAYRKEADEKAWQSELRFLDETLKTHG